MFITECLLFRLGFKIFVVTGRVAIYLCGYRCKVAIYFCGYKKGDNIITYVVGGRVKIDFFGYMQANSIFMWL